jgi:hypothetical protein
VLNPETWKNEEDGSYSNKEIVNVLLLIPLMSAGMVNLIQQSKACDGNNIFQDNGSTSDINGNKNIP